jgi:hypothetical protein
MHLAWDMLCESRRPHAEARGTRRGAVDRTYKINKIYRILTDGGYRSALAFALRMERLKIPNPTSELAGMRLFTLPYPDESGLCAPIGEARPMRGQGRGRSPRCPKIPARLA